MLRGILVLLIGLGITISWIGFEEASWGRLQRYYFQTYLSSTYQNRNCRLLYVLYANGWRVARDRDVDRGTAPTKDQQGAFPFVLSTDAVKKGAKGLEWREFSGLSSASARKYLQSEIYAGQRPLQLIAWPIVLGPLFTVALLGVILRRDTKALQDGMRGKIVRGPRLVSCSEFNSSKESDGVGFEVLETAGTLRRFLQAGPQRTMLRVRADEETSHFILVGDSGTGKSSLIRELLTQVRSRGERAIIYDPATEFTPQFYDPLSDIILNPTDRRMPFWTPSDEIRHPVDAAALASSLFPDKLGDKNFFTDSAKKIFAHLLRYRPTPQELTYWMRNIDELDKRVAGSEFEPMIRKSAAAQRAAVQGTFNQAAVALHLLPAEADTKIRWSAAKWAEEKKGWIFLPSMPVFRESLRPLASMWLDSLIMRLMDSTNQPASRVWLILDELSSLQRLPQLPTAITEGRKWNMCIVLGFQGRSQLEAIYGQQSEAMLSQPMTKVFLRTSEPNAAQWVSRSIGEVELLRREDAHTWNFRLFSAPQRGATTQVRRHTEPLVLPSTIQGLKNLTAYMKSKDLVVPVVFGYKEFKQIHSGFEPRELPGLEPLSLVEAPIEEPRNSAGRKKTGRKTRKQEQQSPPSQFKIFE